MKQYPVPKTNYLPNNEWKEYATCIGADEDDFFPSNGRPSNETFRFCSNCLVRARCGIDGTLSRAEGIWGGIVGTDRETALENTNFRKKLFLNILEEMSTNEEIAKWLEYSREISGIDDRDDRVVAVRNYDDLSPELMNKIALLYFIYGYENSTTENRADILDILENHNILLDSSLFGAVHDFAQRLIRNKQKIDLKDYIKIHKYITSEDNSEYIENYT